MSSQPPPSSSSTPTKHQVVANSATANEPFICRCFREMKISAVDLASEFFKFTNDEKAYDWLVLPATENKQKQYAQSMWLLSVVYRFESVLEKHCNIFDGDFSALQRDVRVELDILVAFFGICGYDSDQKKFDLALERFKRFVADKVTAEHVKHFADHVKARAAHDHVSTAANGPLGIILRYLFTQLLIEGDRAKLGSPQSKPWEVFNTGSGAKARGLLFELVEDSPLIHRVFYDYHHYARFSQRTLNTLRHFAIPYPFCAMENLFVAKERQRTALLPRKGETLLTTSNSLRYISDVYPFENDFEQTALYDISIVLCELFVLGSEQWTATEKQVLRTRNIFAEPVSKWDSLLETISFEEIVGRIIVGSNKHPFFGPLKNAPSKPSIEKIRISVFLDWKKRPETKLDVFNLNDAQLENSLVSFGAKLSSHFAGLHQRYLKFFSAFISAISNVCFDRYGNIISTTIDRFPFDCDHYWPYCRMGMCSVGNDKQIGNYEPVSSIINRNVKNDAIPHFLEPKLLDARSEKDFVNRLLGGVLDATLRTGQDANYQDLVTVDLGLPPNELKKHGEFNVPMHRLIADVRTFMAGRRALQEQSLVLQPHQEFMAHLQAERDELKREIERLKAERNALQGAGKGNADASTSLQCTATPPSDSTHRWQAIQNYHSQNMYGIVLHSF